MHTSGITLLGLGPGDPGLLTRQAWQILENCAEIYLRTRQHPVVDGLSAQVQVHSFDALYESEESFEAVYARIVEQVLEYGRRPQGVVYAVPGHPFVAEATAPEIARRARAEGLPVRVVEGLSFLEPTFTALGLDPFPHTALVDALELAALHVPPFPTSAPVIVAQIYSREVATDVKLTLMALYPDEHPVKLLHAVGTSQQVIESLALYEIDRSPHIGLLTALYVPPLGPATSFEAFHEVIAYLRAPEGCPWDRKQTHQSLRAALLEETYEVLATLDADDPAELQEELGDLLLHILMQAQIASDEGEFSMADVLQGVNTKLVRRHPHVFGDWQVKDAQGVVLNWERLKAEERAANGKAQAGLLDSVALALPALSQAEQYQQRVARVGFDLPDLQSVLDDLKLKLNKVETTASEAERFALLGDMLFAVVTLAREYKLDVESALRETNARFRQCFARLEAQVREQGKALSDLSPDEKRDWWQEARCGKE